MYIKLFPNPLASHSKWISVSIGVLLLFLFPSLQLFAQGTFVTNGSAFSNGGNCFTLTPAATGQTGSVWNSTQLNLKASFDLTFSLNLGSNAGGADGVAFVLQQAGITTGGDGNSLGYGGINPSVDVEFDTYRNQDNRNDPPYDHISIQANGNASHYPPTDPYYPGGTLSGPVQASASNSNIKDGQWHSARVTWDAPSATLTVYFDGVQRISYTNDFINNIFGGKSRVYWGFTGATGGLYNLQQFCVTNQVITPYVAPPLVVNQSSINVSCYQANNGTASVAVSGGSAPYSVTWSNGQSGNTAYSLAPGTYTATVTDDNGTTVSKAVTITQPQPASVSVSASGPTSFCTGGNVTLTASSSVARTGLRFNGTNHVEVPNSTANTPLSSLTVETWVKINDLSGGPQYIVSKGTDDLSEGQYGLLLVHNSQGTPVVQFHFWQNNVHNGVDGSIPITAGQWYHIAGSWDGTTASLYINGVLDRQQPFAGPLTANSGDIQIGRLGKACCPYPLIGDVDEVRIWNLARTQGEIQFNMGRTVYNGSPGLVGYYKFDEGGGLETADDARGTTGAFPVNGILVNSPTWIPSSAPINFSTFQWSPGGASGQAVTVNTTGSYTVTASDANNCAAISTPVPVNVTQPVINCPSDISVNVDPSSCGAVVTYPSPLTSGCQGTTIVQLSGLPSGSQFPIGLTNNSFQIKDNAGNLISTCSFNVTVTDNIKPVISCPANISVTAASGQCGANVTWSASSVVDQQQTAGGSATYGSNQWQSFTAGISGKLTEIQLFTNGYSSGTQPYIFSVYAGQGTGGTLLYSGSGSFNTPFANWFSLSIPMGSAPALVAGSVYTFQIQISGNYNQLSSNNSNAYSKGVYFSNVYGLQTSWDLRFQTFVVAGFASDNCGTPTVTSDHNSGDFFPVGTTTVTQTAKDASGNTASCSFTVTVNAPQIAVRGNNISIADGKTTTSPIDNTDFGGVLPGTAVTKSFVMQNTGHAPLTISGYSISGAGATSYTASGATGNVQPGDSITLHITFTATAAGQYPAIITINNNDCNQAQYTFDITAQITCAAPVFTQGPGNQNLAASGSACSAIASYAVVASGTPTPSYTYSFSGVTSGSGTGTGSGTAFNFGTTNVTVTATNTCGSISSSFAITVLDTTAPLITAPAPITINNDPGQGGATLSLNPPYASDNCGIKDMVNDHTSSFYPVGVTFVKWTVTDIHGNKATTIQTVTITDREKPKINCLDPITVSGGSATGVIVNFPTPFANDNYSSKIDTISAGCSDNTIVFSLKTASNVSNINFVTSGPFSDLAHGHGLDVKITTDLFNPASGAWIPIQSIQTGIGDFHFGGTSISFTSIPQVSQIRFTADRFIGCAFHIYKLAVKSNSSSVIQIAGLPSGSVFPPGITTNTFVATDSAGNKDTCSFTVTVNVASSTARLNTKNSAAVVTPTTVKSTASVQKTDKISLGTNKDLTTTSDGLKVRVYPVPTQHTFTFVVTSPKALPVDIRILDNSGKLVEVITHVSLGSTVQCGGKLPSGVYYAEVTQGDERRLVKITKVR